ncbi:RluA family pseudouridine synthase [Streptococcus sp. zg-JUN1979]|uniref:RluA family pseudouridine synthase n=1 Tax=Streptococcus sp. zg-JUN1979 TaxID=3391450 RepID=UPI0039A5855A
MTFQVTFNNPYPPLSVKTLLEEKLLVPRKSRHFLRTKKHLLINGEVTHWQTMVETGDNVTLIFDTSDYPQKEVLLGDASLVQCLYEDEHLIIVNKAEGMKTHPNQPGELALLNHVSAYTQSPCYVVHRLDKETSGAIVFAKNPFILPLLNRLLESKKIKRHYWALVDSKHFPKHITFRDKIGRDRHDRRRRIVDKHGQVAITHAKRLKQLTNTALIECQLETGRTHQIRVHLSHHGYPLIGDPLYHPKARGRLMLHAHRLSLKHPLTNQDIVVSCQSPSFEKRLQTLT